MLTPFHDLDEYLALPRISGLRLAPDGTWLAVSMSALSPDRRTFKPSIWRLDTTAGPGGPRPAVRLTCSAEGEDSPAFLPDGGLLFLSSRPVPPGAAVPGAAPPGAAPAGAAAQSPGSGLARPAVPGGPAAPADAPGKRALWLLPAAGGETVPAPVGAGRDQQAGHRLRRPGGRVHRAGAARGGRARRTTRASARPGRTRG